jgi:hypothetical protein
MALSLLLSILLLVEVVEVAMGYVIYGPVVEVEAVACLVQQDILLL